MIPSASWSALCGFVLAVGNIELVSRVVILLCSALASLVGILVRSDLSVSRFWIRSGSLLRAEANLDSINTPLEAI